MQKITLIKLHYLNGFNTSVQSLEMKKLSNINKLGRMLINKKEQMMNWKQLLLAGLQRIMYTPRKRSIKYKTSRKFTRTDLFYLRYIFSFSYTEIDAFIKYILTMTFHPSNALRSSPSLFMSEFPNFSHFLENK